ncbi:MAG: tandem-95 repeat protein, partial [Cocleimonas sp.]|nr:tandem-95 repeat protein [Cocleimonas sp.]
MTSKLISLRSIWLSIVFILIINNSCFAAEPSAFQSWAKTAKIGGAAIYTGMTSTEMNQILDNMISQHVTVIEADSDLSNYQSDAKFELELVLIRKFTDAAHQRGLRVVWYIPALEVITMNGKNINKTMAKDHPDWLQIGLTGQENVFYGGGGQVFWVEPDAESAWMSPSSSGYRHYFFERVKKIVATGVDGLWADVPIYADFGPTKWSGFNPEAVTKFESDTGFSRPTAEDWNDPAWRRWIHWRHEELARFLTDLTNSARSINPEFAIFAETLPTDYNGGTIYGLDASYLKTIEGLTEVWEIDTMSNNVGMRNARSDDWISFISALKYARGATGHKPSWVFSYGKQADDAQQVMVQALIAGNNPYELKVPEMATTVGSIFRTRMFNWTDTYSPYLFNAQSTAKTGVLFSSESRDYVDKFSGLGMFATTDSNGDNLWWAGSPNESVYQRDYLAEHRGLIKILVNEHIPFNVLVRPDSNELNQYQTLLLPNVEAISDAESNLLKQYVQQGGHLIITGPNPTGLNEYGNTRGNYALASLLGFNKGDTIPNETTNTIGAGSIHYYAERLGKQYLTTNNSSARNKIASDIRSKSNINIQTNADSRIYVETSQLGEQAVLQFVNYIGMNGSFSIEPRTIEVTYTIPELKQVSSIVLTNPDNTAASPSNIVFTQSGSDISFNIPITQYALVLISYSNAQNVVHNHTPVANDDKLTTNINTALTFSHSSLLSNDGDLDPDILTIQEVKSTTGTVGSISNQGNGNYTYTPANNFAGIDTLEYTLNDGNGNEDKGIINIHVGLISNLYVPETITLLQAIADGDNLADFTSIDGLTYDIKAKTINGSKVVDWYATTTLAEDAANIDHIKISYLGQYSHANTNQTAYLYNFQSSSWEVIDTAIVGNVNHHPISYTLNSHIERYMSPQKKIRLRIKGVRSAGDLYSWSDQLSWKVTTKIVSINTAPIANNQTITVSNNTSTATTLTASDADNDTLSYLITIQPSHGSLSGTAPNLSYQPTAGYTGSDSFQFTANDGQANSNTATVSITVTGSGGGNPNSNATITVDGDLSDWAGLQSFGSDPEDVTGANNLLDWKKVWMADNASSNSIYLAYETKGPIQAGGFHAYQVFLDTDESDATGYKVGALGADYMLEGANLYHYAGAGTNWAWQYVNTAASGISGNKAEFQLFSSWIGSPTKVRLFFYGNNATFGGNIVDVYPDDALTAGAAQRYFTYQFNGGTPVNPSNPVINPITLDGQLNDWLGFQSFAADPDEITGANNKINWLQGWFAHSANDVYLAYKTKDPIDTNGFWGYQMFFDTDENTASGYQTGGLGAEYLFEGTTLYQYTGTGTNWSWTVKGTAAVHVAGNIAEMRFARSLISNPSKLRVYYIGNSAAVGGTATDVYPDGALDANANVRYFTYEFGVTTPAPVIPSNLVSNITMDGSLTEWSGLQSFTSDPDDIAGVNNKINWLQGWLAHSSSKLYFAYKTKDPVDSSGLWGYQIYLDTD